MQYTVENIPDEIERALRERAATENIALDRVLIDALARGLGLSTNGRKSRNLSNIAGKGLITAEMRAAFEEQRQVDPALWR